MSEKSRLVEFVNIEKTFPGVQALKDVSFDIEEGEVHALVGENGAGKTTLIKILSGVQQKDSGTIVIQGMPVDISNPSDAFSYGITCIYQELPLATSLSISDNIFLGQEKLKNGVIDKPFQNNVARDLFKEFDIEVDPSLTVEKLSVSMQQITAIVKAMMKEAKLFIMDEPTAALGEHEVQRLFDFIQKMKGKGISILYISHRMDEIFGIADRVTVLKDGMFMGTRNVKAINKNDLIALMSGKDIHDASIVYDQDRDVQEETVLDVSGLSLHDTLKDISFSVRRGEIFGITGLVGAGKSELLKCIYGLLDFNDGTVTIKSDGTDINVSSASKRRVYDTPFGFVPEDRKREGLFLNLDVIKNISISSLRFLTRFLYINRRKETHLAKRNVGDLDIKLSSLFQQVQYLSGGNQQKVILSRWLSSKKKILLLDEPTRGVDVLAKTEIYKLINNLSKQGISILFSSSDVSEVLSIADRIATIRRGKIVEVYPRMQFEKEKVLHDIMFD